MTTTLVLGAARNGKSAYAVSLLAAHDRVTYLATGRGIPDSSDPVWRDRVESSRAVRPEDWKTVETTALSQALVFSRHPVIIDTLSHWLWRVLDEHGLWGAPAQAIHTIDPLVDELLVAYTSLPHDVVAISDEVGWGLPANTERERTHHEVLSHVNHRFSAQSDRVHLIVGGRVVDLSDAPSLLGATRAVSPAFS
ncbi:bifunctional adenosylcobinamide kinase/adenosylcobinamide-phosphate guanylyltransferase [Ornithinimicrobium faecis]|uniref:Adenosylcobinamide kinase n=1 Tax=Ornithinimicrobium faecis TaxID=2934158 RepID=A0ABY4YXX6_9MICO|nr:MULTISPECIES: bifunctional adenosylcobinamide kinase/adenosylcobinamide-phosphate guanylyltransferase [unclassified Ornithinimicrobium]USQ81638.1 bifunctional adenosylcobinamide kinase/adenosylcobinamide-phosphate guanylyltransferase [Ornithinimicrobium sp. HY1793]